MGTSIRLVWALLIITGLSGTKNVLAALGDADPDAAEQSISDEAGPVRKVAHSRFAVDSQTKGVRTFLGENGEVRVDQFVGPKGVFKVEIHGPESNLRLALKESDFSAYSAEMKKRNLNSGGITRKIRVPLKMIVHTGTSTIAVTRQGFGKNSVVTVSKVSDGN